MSPRIRAGAPLIEPRYVGMSRVLSQAQDFFAGVLEQLLQRCDLQVAEAASEGPCHSKANSVEGSM